MKRIFVISVACALLLSSCSTTRVLQENQSRLKKNTITVTNDKSFSTNQLHPYLKQKANSAFLFGWNPFLNLYNTANGTGNWWDKFVKKVGTAPVVFDPDLVDMSIDNLQSHLDFLGYYDSKIKADIVTIKKKTTVNYEITLGKRFVIDSLTMIIPDGEFARIFNRDIPNMTVKKGDFLSEASLEKETARSSQYMRNNGFYGFTKSFYSFEADTLYSRDSASLEMTIQKGPEEKAPQQYYFGKVTISYPANLKFRDRILQEQNTIKPGDMYRESTVKNTYSRFSDIGVFNSVNVEMNVAQANVVDCDIKLSQSKLQGFKANLEASTNSSGLFGISPQLSYYHKNIFRGGERLNISFMGNFQFKFNENVHSNEFGVSSSITFPRFLGLPSSHFKSSVPHTDCKLSYNYQNRPEYTRNIISTSFGYKGKATEKLFYQAYPLQLNIVKLFDLDKAFYESLKNDPFMRNAYQDHFDLGSGGLLYYTTNTDTNPKTSYFYTKLQLDIAGNLLSAFSPLMKKDSDGNSLLWNTPFSQFVRTELTLGKTWVFGREDGQAIATRFLWGAGYAYGNSSALPFEKHFYAGGANSLRGWQARTVGPGIAPMDTSFVIPNQTGDIKLEANLEYRFKIISKLGGALFIDAGNVWNRQGEAENGKFTFSNLGECIAMNWGTGVRVDLNFIVLRVDAGFRIHDPARTEKWLRPRQWFEKNGYAIHFGVGYPF